MEGLTAFCNLTQTERASVRASVDDMFKACDLMDFAIRCASFALQMNDPVQLRHGAIALVIDADALDPRDLYGALGVLNDAAERIRIDLFRDVINALLGNATPTRRKLIEDFFFHPDSVKAIGKLGLELAYVDGMPWFRHSSI